MGKLVSGVVQKYMNYKFFTNFFPDIPASITFLYRYLFYNFYKGIYFIKHCVIVTCINCYATDSHFIKSSVLKLITKS